MVARGRVYWIEDKNSLGRNIPSFGCVGQSLFDACSMAMLNWLSKDIAFLCGQLFVPEEALLEIRLGRRSQRGINQGIGVERSKFTTVFCFSGNLGLSPAKGSYSVFGWTPLDDQSISRNGSGHDSNYWLPSRTIHSHSGYHWLHFLDRSPTSLRCDMLLIIDNFGIASPKSTPRSQSAPPAVQSSRRIFER